MVGTNSISSARVKNGRDKKSKKAQRLPLAVSLAAAGLYAFTYSDSPSNPENGRWLSKSGRLSLSLSSSLRSGGNDRDGGGYNGGRHPNFGSEETLKKYLSLMETFFLFEDDDDDSDSSSSSPEEPIPLPPFTQTEAVSVRGEPPVAINPLRPSISYTWQEHYDAVTEAGHEWCSLLRDSYTCHGDDYTEALRRTPPFDAERFSLRNLPPGSKVLLHSYCLPWVQLLPAVCALGEKGRGYRFDGSGNAFLIFTDEDVEDPNTSALLILSNHKVYSWGMPDEDSDGGDEYSDAPLASAQKVVDVLSADHPWFVPTHVITGNLLRHPDVESCRGRAGVFREAWPEANVVERCERGKLMGKACGSDRHLCQEEGLDGLVHQCVPGPGSIVASQSLVHDLLMPKKEKKEQEQVLPNAMNSTDESVPREPAVEENEGKVSDTDKPTVATK